MSNNAGGKPRRDPISGKAHIINWENPGYGRRRCCSYCYSALARYADEGKVERCWSCGTEFDHSEDEEKEPDDWYD